MNDLDLCIEVVYGHVNHCITFAQRRQLYVSGTGAEGAEKRRDVDRVGGECRGVPYPADWGIW